MAYATRSDIEARFGEANVFQWADLDNTRTAADITARITTALDQAESDVDDALRGGIYTLPVANLGSVTPAAIVDAVAKMAAVWLYELRGVQDFNPDTGQAVHKLIYHKKRAEEMLQKIKTGQVMLDAVKVDASVAPEVIEDA